MFVSMIVCSSSSVDSTNGSRPSARPALLTRMSRPPSSSSARSTNARAAPGVGDVELERDVGSIASTRRAPPATRDARLAQRARGRLADAARRAGDDRRLAGRSTCRHGGEPNDARSSAAAVPRARPAASCARGRSARGASARDSAARRGNRRSGATRRAPQSAGKPLVTVQTWRSCASTTSRSATSARPTSSGSIAVRRALEEDRRRLAQQRTSSTRTSATATREARERVEAVPAGDQDQRARDRRAGERGHVGRDVEERAADVQALARRRARARASRRAFTAIPASATPRRARRAPRPA